jgi:hypothetical protein
MSRLWVAVLAGCGFHRGTAATGDAARDSAVDVTPPDAAPDSAPDEIVIEAESYTTKQDTLSMWSLQTSISGASGSAFMQCGPGTGTFCANDATLTSCAASMRYTFTLTGGATYYVHVRMYAFSAADDTIWYGIDDAPAADALNVSQDSQWHWVTGTTTYPLPPGPHSLTVWQRECGAKVDVVAVTARAVYP